MPKKTFEGLSNLMETKINWRKIEKLKASTIKKVRAIVDEELSMQIDFDPNFIMYHERIQKELGISEKHLYKPFIEDIYRAYETNVEIYNRNKRRVYKLLEKTRCPYKDKWIDATLAKLETVGVRNFKKDGGAIQQNGKKRKPKSLGTFLKNKMILEDFFKVLTKKQWEDFVAVRDDKKFSAMGLAAIGRPKGSGWNSVKNGQSLEERDPEAYKKWQENVNKGKQMKVQKNIITRKSKNQINLTHSQSLLQ
jgi:hypothetical protein